MKQLNTPASIAERIRLARLQRGLSQENLADLLGLSTTAYGDLERGKTELTISRLAQLAEVFNKTLLELIADPPASADLIAPATYELEKLQIQVEKQELELDKLRLETAYYKRRYEERIAMEMARAMGQKQERAKIGF